MTCQNVQELCIQIHNQNEIMKILILILAAIFAIIWIILRDGKRNADKHPLNIKVDEHSPENIIFEEALKRLKTKKESDNV